MNEKMKKLLAAIAAANEKAKSFMNGETKDVAKAQVEIENAKQLQAEFAVEKALYEAEKATVPDTGDKGATKELTQVEKDEKAFISYVVSLTNGEKTDSAGLAAGTNGAIIPTSISRDVITALKTLCPIYDKVQKFYTKGKLEIPVYGTDGSVDSPTGDVTAAYQGAEFTALTAGQGKFTSVELTGYSIGAMSIISKKLINNTDIDVRAFIVNELARSYATFYEQELLKGTGSANGHMTGATTTTNLVASGSTTYTAAAAANIDKFIDMQLAVPETYQNGAMWIMNRDVFAAARKLKDGSGAYYLAPVMGVTGAFGWQLLGKPVTISENMPAATTVGNVPVLYGDFSGMAMKIAQNLEITVDPYTDAAKNAVRFIGWSEADSKVQNAQKICGLKMGATV